MEVEIVKKKIVKVKKKKTVCLLSNSTDAKFKVERVEVGIAYSGVVLIRKTCATYKIRVFVENR